MSRNNVPAALQRRIRERAGDRREYCRLAQSGQEATFHSAGFARNRRGKG